MELIQTDVSDEALVTTTRANMCDFFRHLSGSDPADMGFNAYPKIGFKQVCQIEYFYRPTQ